jgi:hypothetical protein
MSFVFTDDQAPSKGSILVIEPGERIKTRKEGFAVGLNRHDRFHPLLRRVFWVLTLLNGEAGCSTGQRKATLNFPT